MGNIITKIESQKRDKERVNIFVNNEFLFACNAELVYVHNLTKGNNIELDYLKEIIEEDNYIKGKNKALKYLESSYKTEKEVRDKLEALEYEEKTINRVIIFLKDYAFVNDKSYSKLYVNTKIKVQGKNKIKQDLLKKGICEEYIYECFNDLQCDVEENTAYLLAEKRLKVISKSENNKIKVQKKLGDFLMRKGYAFQVISSSVNRLLEENAEIFIEEKEKTQVDENKVYELAIKRYDILKKSEQNPQKLYKKLHDFLIRRGYGYEEIKKVLIDILK
ncbi:MAG: recombination regulator RecX [Clostridium sp.]